MEIVEEKYVGKNKFKENYYNKKYVEINTVRNRVIQKFTAVNRDTNVTNLTWVRIYLLNISSHYHIFP